MTSSNKIILVIVAALLTSCGGGGSSSSGSSSGGTGGSSSSANNVLSITVNGSLCSAVTSAGYLNKPCVSVTICNPGSSTCQTIDDILLDTGSFGLRIFKSVLNPAISLTPIASGSGLLTECAQFGDGTAIWGPVQMASVILGNEPAVQVPLQIGDSTFGAVPTTCTGVVSSPADAGSNGILGVGVFIQDCGLACTSSPNIGIYYTCAGSVCSGTRVALSSQVQNPVAILPQDNNGLIVQLPGVSSSGLPSLSGSLMLGIGTQTNNVPAGVTTYAADQFGEFITTISVTSPPYSGIIDSGTNGYFFTPLSANQLPSCASPNASWFCPSSTVNISATNAGASGSPSGVVSFDIGNFTNITSSNNNVFSNIGGYSPGTFLWGLPFYFGRNVYVGIEGKVSSLGSGPYWAY